MSNELISQYISSSRLEKFVRIAKDVDIDSLLLYSQSVSISKSFYPLFSHFEVFLRNGINECLSDHFKDENWIINQMDGFMSDRQLEGTRYFLKNSVGKSIRFLNKNKFDVTAGKVIAEQSLGFWTNLFDKTPYKLLEGKIIHVFSDKPRSVNRKVINSKLHEIREFRNRIYHNESICFKEDEIDFSRLEQVRLDIYDVLKWMHKDLAEYVRSYDEISIEVKRTKELLS